MSAAPPTAGSEEPTIDWLIDAICPNPGNSPLLNFNKKRLRDLIATQNNATYEAVMEAITDWCQCDGGYVITGGKSMEDDLIEKEPCDECAELRQNIAKIFGKEASDE